MDGRLEIAEKDWAKCDQLVTEMPEFIEDWYLSMRASGTSAKSCKDYLNKVNGYLSYVSDNKRKIKCEQLTPVSVRNYFITKQTLTDKNGNRKQSSKSYRNSLWSCLYNLFTFLSEENYIEKNPIKRSSRPGGSDEDRIREHRVLLTKDDFNRILKSVDHGCGTDRARNYQESMKNRDEAIMRIFMCTGIRESALASINVGDIDFNNSTLFLYDKGNVAHKFILTDECMESINKWKEDRKSLGYKDDALFISSQKNRICAGAVSAIVKKYTKDALGKELSPHKLRSGVCSILYSETGDIEFVRRFIGHSDVSITKRYIVTDGKEMEKGYDILSNIL